MSEIITYPIVKAVYINVYNSATDPETNNTGKLYCGGFNAQNDSGYDFAFFLNRNIKETVIDGKIYKTCHASGHVEPDKAARVIQRYSVGNHHATLLNNIIPENSTYSLLTLCNSKGILYKNHFSATSGGNSTGIKPYMGKYYIGTTVIDAEGGYSNNEETLLLAVVPSRSYFIVKDGLKEIDKNLFFLVCDSYEVSEKGDFS